MPTPTKTGERGKAGGEDNAFDALRLILALLVVYSHAYLLGGFGTEGLARVVRSQTIAGTVGVLGFFGISGFLVTRSYDLRRSWARFARARLLRIVPGFYFALLVTAFVLAPLIARLNPAGSPWSAAAALHYVLGNLLVRVGSQNVGGVLEGLPYGGSINGALWSLFPELCCYGLVMLVGVLGWIHGSRANLLIACAAVVMLHGALVVAPALPNVAPTLLQLSGFSPIVAAFAVGSATYCFRDVLGIGGRSAVIWSAFALVLLRFGGWPLLGPVVLPLALINVAYSFRIRLPFDLSYGIYVLHFPVLQLIAASGVVRAGYPAYLASGLAVTGALAMVSWNLVERPALRLKERGPPPAAVSAGGGPRGEN